MFLKKFFICKRMGWNRRCDYFFHILEIKHSVPPSHVFAIFYSRIRVCKKIHGSVQACQQLLRLREACEIIISDMQKSLGTILKQWMFNNQPVHWFGGHSPCSLIFLIPLKVLQNLRWFILFSSMPLPEICWREEES